MEIWRDRAENASERLPSRSIRPQETAELLGISYSELRKIEKTLSIRRRTIGKSVRYYLPEVVTLMESTALTREVSEKSADAKAE